MKLHTSTHHLRLLSYTKQLTSYVNHGRHEQALSLFHYIHSSLFLSLDPFLFSLSLKSCSALRRPILGASLHTHIIKSNLLSNPFVGCALVDFYGKCVSILSARKLFDEMPQRNVVVWNAMISVYVRFNEVGMGLKLFESMDVDPNASTFNSIIGSLTGLDDGEHKALGFYGKMRVLGVKANLITVLALLPACTKLGALNMIKEIHGYSIRNEIDPNAQLRSCLVEAYGRCGCLGYASNVFEIMGKRDRDVVGWSSLISAYALHGEAGRALETFRRMEAAQVISKFIGLIQGVGI